MKEIIELRKEKEKHFLCEDGTMKAYCYQENIHYNKDGKLEEIDNTLIAKEDTFENKSNDFKVKFSNQKDSLIYSINKDEKYLIFDIIGNNSENCYLEVKENTIKYKNLLKGVDFFYEVISKRIKESIIIKEPRKLNLSFTVHTNLDLILKNNSIIASDGDRVFYKFEPPFMIDNDKNVSANIEYDLKKNDDIYGVTLIFDEEWLSKAAYPVVIDPTISDSTIEPLEDIYIYPGDTNDNRNMDDYLKIGVDENNVPYRSLIKFNLPTIGTSSQIIKAEASLISHRLDVILPEDDIYRPNAVVHKITSPWTETTANWTNINDKYDSKIEFATKLLRTYWMLDDEGRVYRQHSINTFDITNLVKRWYSGDPNYGIMLKLNNETYDSRCDVYRMYSKDNNTVDQSGTKIMPKLIIHYRNQNGLLNYMQYSNFNFNFGTSSINLYNGNITNIFNVNSTLAGKFPVSLNLLYNTNDAVLGRYQKGWRLSLEEKLSLETIDNKEYIKYIDSTSNESYFYKKEETINDKVTISYLSEDGQNLTIKPVDNSYSMTDKVGNEKKFTNINSEYVLTKIINVEKNEINLIWENGKLTKVIDANKQEITIGNSKIESAHTLTVIDNNLSVIYTSKDKNYNNTTDESTWISKANATNFTYNTNGLITKIVDRKGASSTIVSGLAFEYYDTHPYRIKKITELGLDEVEGKSLSFEYDFNTTTITNEKGHKYTYTFNNQGNLLGTTIMSPSGLLKDSYGFNERHIEAYGTNLNNKISSSSPPLKYAGNTIDRYNFDEMQSMYLYFMDGEFTTEKFRSSSRSYKGTGKDGYGVKMRIDNLDLDNKLITVSGYIKNNSKVLIDVTFENYGMKAFPVDTIEIPASDEFTRFSYTYNTPGYGNHIDAKFKSYGDYYITDCQIDLGAVPEPYNMIPNSDFKEPLTEWTYRCSIDDGIEIDNPPKIITLSNGENVLKIDSNPDASFVASYKYNLNGKKGDVYNLSFWYKNEGTNDSILEFVGNKVNLQFFNTDLSMGAGTHNARLNYHDTKWQFFTETFVAENDYTGFALNILSLYETNHLYITNMMLVRDLGQYQFTYDAEGNLISTKDLANKESNLKYDNNNQLIGAFTPKGNHFSYEYDNIVPTRILKGISPTGISNKIEYDFNGNPIKTIINNINLDDEIKDNTPYYIRLKGTKKYIDYDFDTKTLIFKECNCNHKTFKVHKVDIPNDGTYYRIEFLNKYIGFDGEKITLTKPENLYSLFTITKKNNGSYNFTPKYRPTSQTFNLGIKDNNLSILEADDDDYNQQFYFEDIYMDKFIETTSTYTEDGRFITSVSDALGKKTTYDIDSNNGLVNNVTDPKGTITSYEYNEQNQVTSITNNDKVISYEYNQQDNLSKITSGNKSYTFEYDEFSKPKNVKINDNTLITNEYEPNNGNLLSSTYGNGDKVFYTYDEFDRVNTLVSDTATYKYTYNTKGQLGRIDNDNEKYIYQYDFANRLSEYIMDTFYYKLKTHFKYDANSNVTETKYNLIKSYGMGKDELILSDTIKLEYNKDDSVTKVLFDNKELNLNYDYLGRLVSQNISNNLNIEYQYYNLGEKTSLIIKSMKIEENLYEYKYDDVYNITDLYLNGELINHYKYDSLNELIEDDNYYLNTKYIYSYDTEGNILTKKEYNLETNNLNKQDTFEYSNPNWEDQLTKFNDEEITYDEIGNPLTIGSSKTLSWTNGRQLNSYKDISKSLEITYQYNKDGIRLSKTVNGLKTSYYTVGTNIVIETSMENVLYYIRDNNGSLVGFKYNGALYYYVKNLQQDIIGLKDADFNTIATYTYDAWGKLLSIKGSDGKEITNENHIAHINPFRYRSYYYDKETGLYYLKKRYYDPNWCKFINTDNLINKDALGTNTYSYCSNEPINRADSSGQGWFVLGAIVAGAVIGGTIKVISNIVNKKKPLDGVAGAVVGGAITAGMTVASKGTLTVPAVIVGSLVETTTNEYISYRTKKKEVTPENLADTVVTYGETLVNTGISCITGNIVSEIIPVNMTSWIQPEKIISSLIGNYALKLDAQNVITGIIMIGISKIISNIIEDAKNITKGGKEPTVTKSIYPSLDLVYL